MCTYRVKEFVIKRCQVWNRKGTMNMNMNKTGRDIHMPQGVISRIFRGGGLQKTNFSKHSEQHGASAGESALRRAVLISEGGVMKRALIYLLAFTLVSGIFFSYGWGALDTARADGGAGPTHPDAATGAYLIAPNFNEFNASTDGTKAMKMNGDARLSGDGGIRIVPNELSQSGNTYLSRPIYSETGFSAMFEIYMGPGSDPLADGWTFIVSKDSSKVGDRDGIGIGYNNIPNSFCVAYDTWNNFGGGTDNTNRNSTEYVPAVGFGKNGGWTNQAISGKPGIYEPNAPKLIPGNPNVPFTATDINNLASNGAHIKNPGFLAGAWNYSLYCWVDYDVEKDTIEARFNISPERPEVPFIKEENTGVPTSVGDTYYIGFTAGTGSARQQVDLRQFYVLNNYAPGGLEFNDAGTGVDPDIPLVEDFTPPSSPVIMQKDQTFTVGSSTDNVSVKKYQWRMSNDGGVNWVDGAVNEGWHDYVSSGDNFDLTGATRVPFIDNPDEHTLVQARAIDTGGNISQVSSYHYASQPIPVASLAIPDDGSSNVRPDSIPSLSLNFSQEIDVTSPGAVQIVKTSGGTESVTPGFAGGQIAANDTRWNAAHNNLTLPLSGIDYGASYSVVVSGFRSLNWVEQNAPQTFTFSTIGRAPKPSVSIDYENDAIVLPSADTGYLVNGSIRKSDANSLIPISVAGTGAYDWHGQTVSVVRPGNGATIVDSEPESVAIPARPAAPNDLSGYAGKIYGVTTDMEYAASPTGPWTAVSSPSSDVSGSYVSVANGTYYVRYKSVSSGDHRKFASEAATIIVDSNAVTLNFETPVLGTNGRAQQGISHTVSYLTLKASGNISASFKNADISITGTDASSFILTKPNGADGAITSIGAGEQNMSIGVRPKDGLPVGNYKATVQVTYTPAGKDVTHQANAEVHLLVTERTPTPVIDYRSASITGLDPSAGYLIDGVSHIANNQGIVPINTAWFGRGAAIGTQPLAIVKPNSDTLLSSDPAALVIKARPAAPAAIAHPETFEGFADGFIEGVDAQSMDWSSDGGGGWTTDIATLPDYDATGGRITCLVPGANYRLRYKATDSDFTSHPQTLTVAEAQTAPLWSVSLDTAGPHTFDPAKWGYTEHSANGESHIITVTNAGNQPTGELTLSLAGADNDAFSLSKDNISGIKVNGSDSTVTVRPKAGLSAGTYTAQLTVSGTEDGRGGHSAAFDASYGLSFTVDKANITGFAALSPWIAGKATEVPSDRDTVEEIAAILLNGTDNEPAFAGYREVTANLEGGASISLPVAMWSIAPGFNFSNDAEGIYEFNGVLGTLGANVTNTDSLQPPVNVIVNELPYGIRLSAGDELTFTDAQYGYKVGDVGVAPQEMRVTNIGRNPTGEMNASLSGEHADDFELAYGGNIGAAVQIASVTDQGDESVPFFVRPKAGLVPGTYVATVTVTGDNGVSDSVALRFVVSAGRVTGFEPIRVSGGNAGYPADGFAAADVEAKLLELFPTVSAICASGRVDYPVTSWTSEGAYDTETVGSYTFKAEPGGPPEHHLLLTDAPPTLTVVIDETINAASPHVTPPSPSKSEVYTKAADTAGDITLSVTASSSDAGSGGVLSYQWYSSTAEGSDGSPLNGATGSTYTPPRDAVGTSYYYCEVTNTNNAANGEKTSVAQSAVAEVKVIRRPQLNPVTVENPGTLLATSGTCQLHATGGNGTGAYKFTRAAGYDTVATVSEDGLITIHAHSQITVTARREGDSDWLPSAESAQLVIIIDQNPTTVVAPTGLTATYGDALSSVDLSSFVDSGDSSHTPGTWAWTDPADRFTATGLQTKTATFTPADDNQQTVYNIAVSVNVAAKPLTVDISGLTFTSKKYDGRDDVALAGTPALVGVVGNDQVGLDASAVQYAFSTADIGAGVVLRTGDYALTGSDASKYTLTQPESSLPDKADISPGFTPAEGTHFTATPLSGGWTNGDFVVMAKDGYKVSTDDDDTSSWEDDLTFDGSVTPASFYVRRTGADTGAGDSKISQYEISTKKTINYSIDRDAPTAKVSYNNNPVKEFLNTITFGLFFKNTVDILIDAEDTGGSGVEGAYWYIDRNPTAELSAADLDSLWQEASQLSQPSVSENAKFALYVKVADNAGNESQIYTDGIVVYRDSEVSTANIPVTRFADTDADVRVTLNGNAICGLARTADSSPGVDDISSAPAVLERDVHYNVNGNVITLKGAYLKYLKVGKHTFTVSYDPLGESYKSDQRGGSDTNDAPSSTAFTVNVLKAVQTAPVITGPGVEGGLVTKPREDGTLTLSVMNVPDGESAVDYVWSSGNTDVATVSGSGVSSSSGIVTFKSAGTATIAVTRPGDDDYLPSAPASVDLTIQEEITLPTVGGSGVITASAITTDSLTLHWAKATDNITSQQDITYFVYRSESDDISSENHGTLLNAGGTKDLTQYTATGLTEGKRYWFSVVAVDEAGLKTAYIARYFVTLANVEVQSAAQMGGKNGREATTGIRLTFSKPVSGLTTTHLKVSGPAIIGSVSMLADVGATSSSAWQVMISLKPEAKNLDKAQITVTDWVNEDNGRSYHIVPEHNEAAATLYAPSAWPTPAAGIDYVNERLTGLSPGGVYEFANTNNGYGGERVVGENGIYPSIPYGEFGTELKILRIGVPGGVTLDDDDAGHTNSAEQSLNILGRPSQPVLTVTQPVSEGGKGSVTVTNPVSGMPYEYTSAEIFSAINPVDDYDAGKWTNIAGTAETSLTVTDISPGAYYIRVKAASGTSFASKEQFFYVHAYDEMSFTEVLEGYGTEDVAAQAVESSEGTTITAVEWIGTAEEIASAGAWFALAGSGMNWTITPKTGLVRGTYTAKIRITHEGAGDSEQKVTFTVHPNAEFESVVASAEEPITKGGLTNTLTLRFKYPINLVYGDVVLGGAAHETANMADFKRVGDDGKEYVLDISPINTYRTGDLIDITVKLNTHDTEHTLQVGKTGSITTSTAVSIPRSIKSAKAMPVAPGYATGIIQLTFDDAMTLIGAPQALEVTPSVDGPVILTGCGENAAIATVAAVSRVDASKVADGYQTFRIFINVAKGGDAQIAIPSYGITVPVSVEGGIAGGDPLGGVAYFLNGSGVNHLTDMDAYQQLPAVDEADYFAHALRLPTNLEYTSVAAATVWHYGPGDTAGRTLDAADYALTSGGAAVYRFSDTPEVEVPIQDQLILTLNEDWTREIGKHRLVVVFGSTEGERIVAQAAVQVANIQRTYRLAIVDGDGGSGAMASSNYGIPKGVWTAKGDFASGTDKGVDIKAGTPNPGYRFGYWAQEPSEAIDDLPDAETGSVTMTSAAVTLTAIYVDGAPPVTTVLGISDIAGMKWTKGTVKLTATDSDVTAADGAGTVSSITYTVDEGAPVTIQGTAAAIDLSSDGRHTISYHAVDEAGNVEAAKTLEVYRDGTPPTGSIALHGIVYTGFNTSGDTGTFRSGTVNGSLSTADAGSGVAKTEYLLRNEPFGSEDAAKADSNWISAAAFTVSSDGEHFAYARVTDRLGNVGFLGAPGFLHYTDSKQAASAPFTKTSATDIGVDINMYGNVVKGVTRSDGGGAQALADENYEAGDDVITLSAVYLSGLEAGDHTFEITYNPFGRTYVQSPGSDEPDVTTLTITVNKGVPAVTLSTSKASGETAYGENNVTLTASVNGADGFPPGGIVEFFDDHDGDAGTSPLSLGSAPVDGGTASVAVTLNAGVHDLWASYSGDSYYSGADSAVTDNYNVSKLDPADSPVISGEGLSEGVMVKTYGDSSFELAASVTGLETGTYEWRSGNTDVATVGESTGRVIVNKVGEANIFAKLKADDNHNASTESYVQLTVNPALPSITEGSNTASVTYGQTSLAAIDLSDSGYVFGGVAGKGEQNLNGTFTWEYPNAVPGAYGYESDGEGNDAKDGLYLAPARFTPDASYNGNYGSRDVLVPVRVQASDEEQTQFENAMDAMIKVTLPAIDIAIENYNEDQVVAIKGGIEQVQTAVSNAGIITQSDVEKIADIREALANLEQHHPVLENSANTPITGKGSDIIIRIKGNFASVTDIWLNGVPFTRENIDGTSDRLLRNGVQVGTIASGSAMVTLDRSYVDGLSNGDYMLEVCFSDSFKTGYGEAFFLVSRPANPAPPGPPNPTDPANPTPDPPAPVVPTPDVPAFPDPPGGVTPSVNKVSIVGAVPKLFRYKANGVGNTLRLNAVVSRIGRVPSAVSWSVKGPASVNAYGIVTFNGAEGTVIAKATSKFDASKSATVSIKVVKNVTRVRTPLTKVYIKKGKSMILPVALYDGSAPRAYIKSKLTWSSSKPSVLSVAKNGKMKASGKIKKKTKVTVTVTAASGARKAISVYVVPKANKLKRLSVKFPTKMKRGKMYLLKVKLRKPTATGVDVNFTSSRNKIIKVDKAGQLIALRKGKAVITVKAGGKRVKKTITVW
jgi:hypothetical protein